MKPAELTVVTAEIDAGRYGLRSSATHLDYPGFLMVYKDMSMEDEEQPSADLPKNLKAGDSLTLKTIEPSQHFTKPPARYTEATLVKQLEAEGIGRPSTYAQIINTIQNREYVQRDKGKASVDRTGTESQRSAGKRIPGPFQCGFHSRHGGRAGQSGVGRI